MEATWLQVTAYLRGVYKGRKGPRILMRDIRKVRRHVDVSAEELINEDRKVLIQW